MARIDNLTNFLTDVADAIREKKGTQETISAEDFDTEIENLPSGGGDDWSDIGYSSTPDYIQDIHTYSKQIYDNWDADNPHKFNVSPYTTNLVICPLIDTSKMTNMSSMFQNCTSLIEIPTLTAINVQDFSWMFSGCGKLESLDLSNFNTNTATNIACMFRECTNLKSINFGNNFDASNITSMVNMFLYTTKLDDNTLNQILGLCIGTSSAYTDTKTLAKLGITSYSTSRITALSNYQAFLDAGWTIS